MRFLLLGMIAGLVLAFAARPAIFYLASSIEHSLPAASSRPLMGRLECPDPPLNLWQASFRRIDVASGS